MEAMRITPRTLKALIGGTHKVLRHYYKKATWPSIYPTLVKLSQLYIQCYESNPNALHAQLSLYSSNFPYSTNLVINQAILVCMACKQLGFSNSVTEELLLACLADYLCVAKETDMIGRGESLSRQGQKLWKVRHQLTVNLLEEAKTPYLQCLRILSRLSSYSQRLVSPEPTRFTDNASLIVAVAHKLSQLITPNFNKRTLGLDEAIKRLYLKPANKYLTTVLDAICGSFSLRPAGLLCEIDEQQGVLIDSNEQEKLICIIDYGRARKLVKTHKPLEFRFASMTIDDEQLLLKVWFQLETVPHNVNQGTETGVLALIEELSHSRFQSFSALEKLISQHQNIDNALQLAARQYNREHLKAASVRHSLAMVGLDTAGLLSQRVLLEQVIASHPLPFTEDVLAKYTMLAQIIAIFVGSSYGQEYEEILSPFTAVVTFLVLHQGVEIQHLTAFKREPFSEKVISVANLFGIQEIAFDKLNQFMQRHFADSKLHQNMLDSETSVKSELPQNTNIFIFIKLVALKVMAPFWQPTAWQSQFMDAMVSDSEFTSYQAFENALLEAGFYSTIE
ncbi:hypothetical protein ACSLBF_20065 (plasmid) [Pseudoalteromonas sp. T1lg65]|uniref:hypothetical protein n=1 Tax=Pseudoalteromonas sp. T1lg65 TaxID=2077101 RepID=UPI003F78D308